MFAEDLTLTLTVTIDGTSYSINSGQVKNFAIQLHPYGFTGELAFMLDDEVDEIYTAFITQKLATVDLQIKTYFNTPSDVDSSATNPDPLRVKGLVYEKKLQEEYFTEVADTPILVRHYTVQFADSAAVLWKQHFPNGLYTETTMKDVIDAQVTDEMTLTYNFEDVSSTAHSLVFLGLGTAQNHASFYDFLIWYLRENDGILSYNSYEDSYEIANSKDESEDASEMSGLDIEKVEVLFPEVTRHKVRVLNSYTESTASEEIDNEYAVTKLYKDVLMRTQIASDVTTRKTLETAKLKTRGHELAIQCKRFPTITLRPGSFLTIPGGDYSSTEALFANNTYRVAEVSVRATALAIQDDTEEDQEYAGFDIEMKALCELKEESYVRMPHFQAPHYPVHVEGKVVSEQQNEDTKETYDLYEDSDTSLNYYSIKIPLWENKTVPVPFEPYFFPGHFYFPPYKNQRVLVAFDLQKARLARFLDWRSGAALAEDTQGNHLLMGWTNETNQTSMSHVYEDEKPVFTIERKQDSDNQLIQLSDGCLVLQTQEESE